MTMTRSASRHDTGKFLQSRCMQLGMDIQARLKHSDSVLIEDREPDIEHRCRLTDRLHLHYPLPLIEEHPAVFPDPLFSVQLRQLSHPDAENFEFFLVPRDLGRPQQFAHLFQ